MPSLGLARYPKQAVARKPFLTGNRLPCSPVERKIRSAAIASAANGGSLRSNGGLPDRYAAYGEAIPRRRCCGRTEMPANAASGSRWRRTMTKQNILIAALAIVVLLRLALFVYQR